MLSLCNVQVTSITIKEVHEMKIDLSVNVVSALMCFLKK